MRDQLLNDGALLHALRMHLTVFELRQVKLERYRTPEAPEEIRIGRGEMIEGPPAPGKRMFNAAKSSNKGLLPTRVTFSPSRAGRQ